MRKLKSVTRLSLLCLIAWLEGLELILFQNCEIEEVKPHPVDYVTLDREMLEDIYIIEED